MFIIMNKKSRRLCNSDIQYFDRYYTTPKLQARVGKSLAAVSNSLTAVPSNSLNDLENKPVMAGSKLHDVNAQIIRWVGSEESQAENDENDKRHLTNMNVPMVPDMLQSGVKTRRYLARKHDDFMNEGMSGSRRRGSSSSDVRFM
jgi:hypothetical protein